MSIAGAFATPLTSLTKSRNGSEFHDIYFTAFSVHSFSHLVFISFRKHFSNGPPQNFYEPKGPTSFTSFSGQTSSKKFCCLNCIWNCRSVSDISTLSVAETLLTVFAILGSLKRQKAMSRTWNGLSLVLSHTRLGSLRSKVCKKTWVTFSQWTSWLIAHCFRKFHEISNYTSSTIPAAVTGKCLTRFWNCCCVPIF